MFCGLTSNVLAMDKLAPWCLGSNLMNSLAVSRALGSASAQRTLVMVWANEDVQQHQWCTSQKPFTAEADRYSVYLRYLFTWV